MTKRLLVFASAVLLLSSPAVLSAESNANLLADYFAALSSRDLTRLESLLADDFQYSYFEGTATIALNKEEELRGLRKLLEEANIEMGQSNPARVNRKFEEFENEVT